jgi:MFS family permease
MKNSTPSIYTSQFWLLCASNLLFTASFQMIIPELPDHLTQMGGQAYIGLIIFLFTLTAGLSRPFSGKITDTIGRIPVMAFGSLVCCVCALFYPFIHFVAGFMWLRLIHGMSTGTKPTATAAYIADIAPVDRRGEAAGMLGIFTATGMSVGPTIGSYLTEWADINATFYTSSVFALLSILILLNMKETLIERKPFSLRLLRIGRKDIFEPKVVPVFVVMLLVSFASGVTITLAPNLTKSLGMTNKGIYFTVYTIASLLIRLVASKSSDKYGRVPVLVFSCVMLAAGMFVLGFWNNLTGFYLSAVLFGISWGLNTPTLTAWAVDLSDEAHRGRGLATMYIALEAGIGIGALWSGWYYQGQIANMAFTFYVSAALAVVAMVYLVFWKKPTTINPISVL